MNDDSLKGVLVYVDDQPTDNMDNMSSAIRAIPVWVWIAFCDAINPEVRKRSLRQEDNLLGEQVVDKLSGQQAEVLGYDSSTNMYKIEFLDGDDLNPEDRLANSLGYWGGNHGAGHGQMQPYEGGHCAWRFGRELLRR